MPAPLRLPVLEATTFIPTTASAQVAFSIDSADLFAGEKRSRISLPGYPFQRWGSWLNARRRAVRAQTPWYARECTIGKPSSQQCCFSAATRP